MNRGEAMARARRKAGLSQRQLSDLSGLSKTTIARLELGLHNGSITTVELLADALGISIDEYVGHEVNKHG